MKPNIQRLADGQLRDPEGGRAELLLLIGIGVGIWVLGEVKGQDFADHTVPLLKEERERERKMKL